MDKFMPIDEFQGDDDHRPDLPAPFTFGHSHFKGIVAFTNVDQDLVTAMLPPGLALASNTARPALHPILHIAGVQGQTAWSFANGEVHRVDAPYQEFILMVPFTLRPGSSQWHNYVVRMYLDHDIAQEIGELFAYRKVIGFVQLDPAHMRRCRVMNENGRQTFRSTDRPVPGGFRGPTQNARTTLDTFDDIVQVLAMPVLGVNPATGEVICSYFELDFAQASVTAAASQASYTSAFLPGTLAGTVRDTVPGGALLVDDVAWKLQYPPLSCGYLP